MTGAVIPLSALRPERLMLVAVEPSGDALGAALLRELKVVLPGAGFAGCGGPLMAREGLESLFPIEQLSVLGIGDALRAAPAAFRAAKALTGAALASPPSAVIFIDGWGFSRLCAVRMRKAGVKAKLFKFGAPQVWASRPGRVQFVRRYFDGVLCLLPFEPQWFRKAGVAAEFVGNPNFQTAWAGRGDGAAFRHRHGLGRAPLLAVLPGSRRGEISRLMEPIEGAVRLLAERIDGLRIVTPLAPAVADRAARRIGAWSGAPIIVGPDEKADAFAAADAAIAKSGTVTTELAINRTPMVVAYRLDPVSALWAKRVMTTPFATILNVAAGRFVIPELLHGACTPENLAGAALPLLKGGDQRTEQLAAFPELLAGLAVDGPPAARLAAAQIKEWIAAP